jgi:hypothetical protein
MTQKLLRDEFSPALPKGVAKAWTVAAYTSGAAFAEDANSIPPGPDLRLMAKIRQRFLTPVGPDPEQNLLRQAVALARTEEFRCKRADFYAWEESIIEENIQDEKAIEELEHLLEAYNKATQDAFGTVVEKYLFTLLPVTLAMVGAVMANSMGPIVLGGIGAAIQFTRFFRFDTKPSIAKGDLDAAAMIYDARQTLPLRPPYF